MTTATLTAPRIDTVTGGGRPTLVQVLVIGGSVLAPLNLLLVKSFTAYDLVISLALLVLLSQRQLLMPPRRYQVAAYVLVLAAILSSFRATYPIEALTQMGQYVFVFCVLVPVVLSVVRTRRAVVISVLLVCLGSLGAILHSYVTQETQGAGRVLIFYSENPNRLGYPAAFLLPFLLALWLTMKPARRSHRMLAAVACIASAYLVVWALSASASRSSLAGAVVALIVFVVMRPGLGAARMLFRAGALVGGVVAAGLLLLQTGALPGTLGERIERSFSAEDQSSMVGDRERLMDAGIRAFVDSPFLGTGLDNFRHVAVNYELDATPQLPHNLWLQLLVQVGVFGTLAFAAVLLMWLTGMVRCYRDAVPADRTLIWAMAAAMSGNLTILLFGPEMLDRHYWLIFALGLALVDGVRRHNHRQVITS